MLYLSIVFLLSSLIPCAISYPTVLMHGVLANKNNMEEFKTLLETNFDIKVYNMEIGNGVFTSIFTDMSTQLDMLCNEIYKIDELKDGFNFIGMSQGGLLARGYVEHCNKYPVHNLITLASPNGGIYYYTSLADNYYEPKQQDELSISNYWRDPYRYELYLSNSTYLAQLNQEKSDKTMNYLSVVNKFLMIWSPNDEVIEPPESAKFSLLTVENNELKSVSLFDTNLYKNNALGLRKMNEENRLEIFETNCMHAQHKEKICFDQIKEILNRYLI
jgi:palmitoyl-protein thioesterase